MMKVSYLTLAPAVASLVIAAGAAALARQPETPVKTPADMPASTPAPPRLIYTCPMHPQVVQAQPGTCPLCRMSLKPMKVVRVEASQEDTGDRTSATDHGAMPMQSHKGGHEMHMGHGSMNHGMCGCGMCMMMMGMGNMEMAGMEGMNHGSNSATAKPAAQRSYSSGRGSGRGCGC
jgi:hypothetical protein